MATVVPALLAGAAVAAGLAACSSSSDPEPDPEALTGPTHFRRICVSSLHASRWTIAVATGTNDSDRPVTLVDAALTDVEGLDLVRTDVIRPRWAVDTFGVWNGSPPRGVDDDPVSRRLWRSREPVGDLRVEPGERVNFVLHLRGDAGGSAGPLEVTYRTEAGREHTYATNVEYVVERDCTD